MDWRRCISLVLALLLLLSGSGAATLCIEADGSARVELIGAVCCEPADGPHGGASNEVCPTPDCAGCDDRPLEGASWSRQAGPADGLALLPAPLPCPTLAPLLQPGLERGGDAAGPPVPRASRPALLRC